jgi:N-acetyl sugar amidotransferase
MNELKRCSKCITPETQESITFDEKNVCSVCRQIEFKNDKIDWSKRKEDLNELIEQNRGKYDYDCIIPFSGGKDSTWTLYYLMKEYKIKPLVVRFDHGFLRPNLNDNTTRTLRKLGCDFQTFTPNWKVVQKLMLQSFLEKGDFCWHCHTGIFSYPMWVALRNSVPLIIWGEPSAEYTSYYSYDQPEEVDEKRFNRFVNIGINAVDMAIRIGGDLDERDFKPYSYPPLKDLRKLNYRSVCLGSYINWDAQKQSKIIMDELGWKGDIVENVPDNYNYEKIECYMQGVRDYIKYLKRGFTRPTHLASIDIRHDRLARDEALNLIKNYEGKKPPSLDIFLELVGLSEDEFYEIALTHTVSPWKNDKIDKTSGKKIHDFDSWSRDGEMNPEESKKQIDKWRKIL